MTWNPVDEFCRDGLFYFPTLYQTATDVLEHGLCTLGGGCEWEYGELVNSLDYWAYEQMNPHHESEVAYLADCYRKHYEDQIRMLTYGRQFTDDDPESDANERFGQLHHPHPWQIESWEKTAAEECPRTREQRKNVGRLASERPPMRDGRVYPMSEKYANLLNFPDDVHEDWLDAIEFVANEVIRLGGGCGAYRAMDETEAHEKANAENVRIAKLALERVAKVRVER
jgi:hypothetical protein